MIGSQKNNVAQSGAKRVILLFVAIYNICRKVDRRSVRFWRGIHFRKTPSSVQSDYHGSRSMKLLLLRIHPGFHEGTTVWELCLELAKMVFKSEKKWYCTDRTVRGSNHYAWFKPLFDSYVLTSGTTFMRSFLRTSNRSAIGQNGAESADDVNVNHAEKAWSVRTRLTHARLTVDDYVD
jgi:hypothetical protein